MELPGRVLAPGWTNGYVDPPAPFLAGGRSKDGWDCWGLVRVVYTEQFGIELPSYSGDYVDPNRASETTPLFESEVCAWSEVRDGRPGDVHLVAIMGHECHVGVMVDLTRMLHVLEGSGTRVERITTPAWTRRIRGTFRHRLLM